MRRGIVLWMTGPMAVALATHGCGSRSDDVPADVDYVDCVHTTTDDPSRRDTDTLPEGACRSSAPACDLVIRYPCVCAVQLPRSFYTCTCQAGSWTCELIGKDSGLCPSEDPEKCPFGVWDAGATG